MPGEAVDYLVISQSADKRIWLVRPIKGDTKSLVWMADTKSEARIFTTWYDYQNKESSDCQFLANEAKILLLINLIDSNETNSCRLKTVY